MDGRVKKNLNIIIDTIAYAEFIFLASTGLLMRYTLPAGSGHHTTVWGLDRHEWGALHFWIAVAFLSTLALHLILHWNWIVGVLRGRKTESSGLRFGLGLFGLVAVLVLALTPLLSPVEKNNHPGQQRRLERTETVQDEISDEGATIEGKKAGSQQSLTTEQFDTHQSVRREQPDLQQQSGIQQSTDVHESGYEYSFDEVAVRGYMTLNEVSEKYKIPAEDIIRELGLPDNTDKNETFGRLRRIYDFEMQDVRRIILEYQERE